MKGTKKDFSTILILLVHGTFLITNIILVTLVLNGHHQNLLYASFWHKVSRLHPITIQFAISAVIGFFLLFLVQQKYQIKGVMQKFKWLTLLTLDFTVFTGALMEYIEAYPNPLVREHLIFAFVFYLFFQAVPFLLGHRWIEKKAFNQKVLLAITTIILLGVAKWGGSLHKGVDFYTSVLN